MLIGEFNSKFVSEEERGGLFEVLRRVSRLDTQRLLATETSRWGEWPPDGSDDPDIDGPDVDDPPDFVFARLAKAGA